MIKGKKVFLRALNEDDLAVTLQWLNDPEISHLVGGWEFPLSMAHQREWFNRSIKDDRTHRFIVESYEDGVIGLTGLWDIDWHDRHALTSLKLGANNIRGKGYGTDAIMTLMTYAFCEVGLNRLWGAMISYNIASYKTYVEKCGWKVEGVFRQQLYRDGRYYDQLRVAILRDEFLQHPLAADYLPAVIKGEVAPKIEVKENDFAPEVRTFLR